MKATIAQPIRPRVWEEQERIEYLCDHELSAAAAVHLAADLPPVEIVCPVTGWGYDYLVRYGTRDLNGNEYAAVSYALACVEG